MKIGILTYHRSENYGAALQAYALKKALQKMAISPIFVDYQHIAHNEMYALFSKSKFYEKPFLEKIKYLLSTIYSCHRKYTRKKNFQVFFNHYIKGGGLGSVDDLYDTVIYGSDQIWRKQEIIGINSFLEIYFGSNAIAAKRKISYAASMGEIQIEENDLVFLKSSLSNFHAISVREDDLKELVEEKVGLSATHVVDPVFLLDEEGWQQITSPRLIESKYILFYHLGYNAEAVQAVKNLKEQTQYKVVELNGKIITRATKAQRWNVVGPSGFLSLLRHAEIVVTSSFHGICFSLLFNKTFYAFLTSNSRRIESILIDLDLQGRIVKTANEVSLEGSINWQSVNLKMKEKKNSSLLFLMKETQIRK